MIHSDNTGETVPAAHNGHSTEAYSYIVPNSNVPNLAPLLYTVCGNNLAPLANVKPC